MTAPSSTRPYRGHDGRPPGRPRGLRGRWRRLSDRARRRYRRLPRPVRTFTAWLRSSEFLVTSSSLAFYAMVALPPMVLITFWVAGVFVDEEALGDLGREVDDQSPDRLPVADVLQGLIEVAGRIGFTAVLAAVWPATTYGAALARAFGEIAPATERQIRGWRGRLLALVVIAVLPATVFLGLASIYLLPRLLDPGWPLRLSLGAGTLVVCMAFVALVYWLFELHDTRWTDVVLGAATATALIATSTAGYVVYLEFSDFTERYGSAALATAVLLGLWLLLGNAALLVGYRVAMRRAHRRTRGNAPAGDEVPHEDTEEDSAVTGR
ncbi:YihY/virulence factor BrkB family protein [Trujillonella humicola]|uniref:YihY/virulence factor BrkB family protein n=1 Tax=Trujillonella humicola TaxID=3383699 RepID=UPI00390637BB